MMTISMIDRETSLIRSAIEEAVGSLVGLAAANRESGNAEAADMALEIVAEYKILTEKFRG